MSRRRRAGTPHGHTLPRPALRVSWPANRALHFDRRETLHIHTLADASVQVTLLIVGTPATGDAHGLGRGFGISTSTMRARADRHGDVAVPLRYAYVPTRPMPATLTVTAHAGRRTMRSAASVTLVRG